MGGFRRAERMLFVPGLGTVELASVGPGLDQVRERVAGEHHQVAATCYEPLKLLAFFAAGVLAMTDPEVCRVVIQEIRLLIVVGVDAVVYLVTLGVQP